MRPGIRTPVPENTTPAHIQHTMAHTHIVATGDTKGRGRAGCSSGAASHSGCAMHLPPGAPAPGTYRVATTRSRLVCSTLPLRPGPGSHALLAQRAAPCRRRAPIIPLASANDTPGPQLLSLDQTAPAAACLRGNTHAHVSGRPARACLPQGHLHSSPASCCRDLICRLFQALGSRPFVHFSPRPMALVGPLACLLLRLMPPRLMPSSHAGDLITPTPAATALLVSAALACPHFIPQQAGPPIDEHSRTSPGRGTAADSGPNT